MVLMSWVSHLLIIIPERPLIHISAEATEAFEEALRLDPNNAQARSDLKAVERAMASSLEDKPGLGGLGNMFNDPQLIQKLARDPRTSKLLADPTFMAKLQQLKQNPQNVGEAFADPRILTVMSVLLGIDMSFASGSSGGAEARDEEDTTMPDAPPLPKEPRAYKAPESQPEPQPEPQPKTEPEDDEAAQQRKAKEEAEAEKKLGTENYKKRQFDAAIEHYSNAWELHKDITYLTNISAAKYEKGDYEGAIEACRKAIEEGREVLADFKIIAK